MTAAIRPGEPEPLGLTLTAEGANIAVASSAEAIDLLLYEGEDDAPTRIYRLPGRLGNVWHGFVEGLREGARYALRAHGPFDPARGLRFDPTKRLVDPYVLQIDRPFRPGAETPLGVAVAPEPIYAPRALRPWSDLTIYELHPRGFTARMEGVAPHYRGTLRGLADPAAVGYLVDLGVTAVELMPCAAWIDERHLPALGLENAWGYNPVALMAPDPRLAPGGWADVAAATQALAAAGIETILDVVFNHTGETDEFGPTLSLRGLDDALYYRQRADDPGLYVNDAGCGNTLALDRPTPLRLVLDALRAWAIYGGVSGFRFDLATTLARRADGFDAAAPFLAAIRQDPILRGLRMIAEPWDLGPGGYRLGAFPEGWGEWNDKYRDTTRRFWRGDAGLVGDMATRLAGSQDAFAAKTPARSVNYVVAHDGFTLADLVAYARKRNEANGEANRDGTDDNLSWTNGVEGPTDDPAILAARRRDQRALLATLIFSRGTPMIAMGAEAGHTQNGNNNAYAQPRLSEIDWANADADLRAVARRCLALRRAHPALRADAFLTGAPPPGCPTPDVAWLTPEGAAMAGDDWGAARALIVALSAPSQTGGCDRVLLALNPTPAALTLTPPAPRGGFVWTRAFDSSGESDDLRALPARAVVLLIEEPDPDPRRREGVDDALLDTLAQAAGVSSDWWDISGRRHEVPAQTKRAVLAALGFDTRSAGAVRDGARRLADEFDRRALPYALAARSGAPVVLRLPGARPPRLFATRDGETTPIAPLACEPTRWRARDGGEVEGLRVTLPPQPDGETELIRDDAEARCALLVAGPCWLPRQKRLGGLAAQLYALRRDGDQGVGDLTTLAELMEGAARAGLDAVGINPLHALFPHDPQRASPYSPSDRRRLDPLYVDLARLGAEFGLDLRLDPPEPDREVNYPLVRAARRAGFARAFATLRERLFSDDALGVAFRAFVEQGGEALARFALHQALTRDHGDDWRQWQAPLRDADPAAMAQARLRLRAEIERILFEQWAADSQLADAARRGRDAGLSLGLYRDLAVGAAPDGAEAWANRSRLLAGLSIGAPPDPLGPLGQVWGLPPPDPHAGEREAGRAFAALIADNMRHAGALRIDHALGLARLFVVPEGASGAEGCYLAQPQSVYFARLALESARAGCLVVGEDLGTAPNGFHETLESAAVLSYRVAWFERDGARFRPPTAYPHLAAACVTTHDLPTLAGWWDGADIAERLALGLLDEAQAATERDARAGEKRAFVEALRAAGALEGALDVAGPYDPRLAVAAHAFIAATPALLALGQADDCVGETVAVNLPGTDRERPNWRRRLSSDLAAILASPALAPLRRN